MCRRVSSKSSSPRRRQIFLSTTSTTMLDTDLQTIWLGPDELSSLTEISNAINRSKMSEGHIEISDFWAMKTDL